MRWCGYIETLASVRLMKSLLCVHIIINVWASHACGFVFIECIRMSIIRLSIIITIILLINIGNITMEYDFEIFLDALK